MPNTYTQLYVHCVFAVQNRDSLISEKWQSDLYKYMSGIIEKQGHKLLSLNGMPNHIHFLVGLNPTESISDLMYHVKRSSSMWINENRLAIGKFSWQEGYGAFSYAKSQLPNIINYIERQKEHHQKQNFHDEYLEILNLFGIEFDERYIFKSIE